MTVVQGVARSRPVLFLVHVDCGVPTHAFHSVAVYVSVHVGLCTGTCTTEGLYGERNIHVYCSLCYMEIYMYM